MRNSKLLKGLRRDAYVYNAGQPVMVRRSGKGTRTKTGWGGKWFGPGSVLVHQRSRDGAPSKIVWVSLGGKLYRVAPEHLRLATEREGILFEANYPRMDDDPAATLQKGEFEDLTNQAHPPTDAYDLGD